MKYTIKSCNVCYIKFRGTREKSCGFYCLKYLTPLRLTADRICDVPQLGSLSLVHTIGRGSWNEHKKVFYGGKTWLRYTLKHCQTLCYQKNVLLEDQESEKNVSLVAFSFIIKQKSRENEQLEALNL